MAWFFCKRTHSVKLGMVDGRALYGESPESAAKNFLSKEEIFDGLEEEVDVYLLPEEPKVVTVRVAMSTKRKGRA